MLLVEKFVFTRFIPSIYSQSGRWHKYFLLFVSNILWIPWRKLFNFFPLPIFSKQLPDGGARRGREMIRSFNFQTAFDSKTALDLSWTNSLSERSILYHDFISLFEIISSPLLRLWQVNFNLTALFRNLFRLKTPIFFNIVQFVYWLVCRYWEITAHWGVGLWSENPWRTDW